MKAMTTRILITNSLGQVTRKQAQFINLFKLFS